MQVQGDFAAGVFSLLCILPVVLLSLLSAIFWVWMLVDCVSNEPSEGNDKVVWVVVIALLNGLGALLYFFIRRPQRIRQYGR